MKRFGILLFIFLVLTFANTVNARTINFEEYDGFGIKHSFVVGDYIFDLDNGYSPSLQDILRASRSIKNDQPTTLYEINSYPEWNYFTMTELYSNKTVRSSKDFIKFDALYIYRTSLIGASNLDYDYLS